MTTQDDKTEIEIPSEILCPNVQEADVIDHLRVNYGLKVTQVKRLNGYDDCNFHVKVDKDHSNPNIKEIRANGYFVKVSNINDSNNPEILRAQLAAMRHLASKGIPCQNSVSSLQNQDFTDIKATSKKGEERTHKVALRTYLPGEILATATLTPALLYNVGVFVATVTTGLEDFHHPFYKDHGHLWTLDSFPKVAKCTSSVTNEKHRRICEDVLKTFDKEVVPQKVNFRKGQVHGDINEQNVLVHEVDGAVQVCGLLDFQDMADSHPVYDLALAAAYMMTVTCSDVPRTHIPGHVLAGYSSMLTLTPAEGSVFPVLVAARLVQSLVYGAYSYQLDPTNEYLLETSKSGWNALELLWEAPREDIHKEWTRIVESSRTSTSNGEA